MLAMDFYQNTDLFMTIGPWVFQIRITDYLYQTYAASIDGPAEYDLDHTVVEVLDVIDGPEDNDSMDTFIGQVFDSQSECRAAIAAAIEANGG